MNRMSGRLGFDQDIKLLISEGERACMLATRSGIDLHDWQTVSRRAEDISNHLKASPGYIQMPPGAPWPPERIATFDAWVSEGSPLGTGDEYASFFRSIDARTEYFDVYNTDAGVTDLRPYYSQFWGSGKLLSDLWANWFHASQSTPILKNLKGRLWKKVTDALDASQALQDAILKVDEAICELAFTHFTANGQFDPLRCLDAFRRFGADILPFDQDRVDRVTGLGDPEDYRLKNDFAGHHRMDTRELYFYWYGHLQIARSLTPAGDPYGTVRDALAAGLLAGQISDTAFRQGSSRKTRPEYLLSRETVWQTAVAVATDFEATSAELQELYYIFAAPAIV